MLLYVDVQYASPYALSAFVALQEKGLSFTIETLDLAAGDQQRPDFARLSISGRVPTLVDGDFALSESSAIAEYVDEVHPGPALYPSAPRARARARQPATPAGPLDRGDLLRPDSAAALRRRRALGGTALRRRR